MIYEGTNIKYTHVPNLIALFFCGYVITWYLQIGSRIPFLGNIRFEFIYAVILAIIAISWLPCFSIDPTLLTIIISYFLILFVQVLFSQDANHSYTIFLDRIVKFSVFGFFVATFVRSPLHLRFFLAAFLLACLKMGIEGFIGNVSGNMIWENQGVPRLHGSTSLYEHPNSFAGMALGTLPFVYKLYPLSSRTQKLLLLSILAFSIHIIIFTGSRTGYVGIIFLAFLILRESKNKKTVVALIMAAVFTVSITMPKSYANRFMTIFTQEEVEGASIAARKQIMKDAVDIFAEYPLGVGVAAFPKVRLEMFKRSQDTHNLYLEIATNLGVPGLLVFFLLIIKLRNMLKKTIAASSAIASKIRAPQGLPTNLTSTEVITKDMLLVSAVAQAVWIFVLLRLVVGFFGMDLYEIYWWFAIGLSISLANIVWAAKAELDKESTTHGQLAEC